MEIRLPKFMAFIEEFLAANEGGKGYLVGKKLSFADVAMVNLIRGYKGSQLEHYEKNSNIPLLKEYEKRLFNEPRIKDFMESDRTVNHFYDSFS